MMRVEDYFVFGLLAIGLIIQITAEAKISSHIRRNKYEIRFPMRVSSLLKKSGKDANVAKTFLIMFFAGFSLVVLGFSLAFVI